MKYKGYTEIEKIGEGFENPLPLLESSITEDISEKRLSRVYRTDLFPQNLSITKSKTYFVIAHLTPADLSMLTDFNEIKEDLSIVNGSFVTLGKPLKFLGRNVHIRDTMLLAPAGNRSLAGIGRLYGGIMNKVRISKEDLEDMQGFLKRDKEMFIEYAIKDALISLIHAS